eukprot:gene16343-biopygen12033
MQTVADDNGMTIKDRKCVIDWYFGQEITIIDEYFVWLVRGGVRCTKIYSFLRFKKEQVFAEFGRNIMRLRVRGDRDKSSEMKANTAEHRNVLLVLLLDTGATEQAAMNRLTKQHMETREQLLTSRRTKHELASQNTFVRYEQVCPQVLEVEMKKQRVIYDQVRCIGKTIFDHAKLSVLRMFYDFLKRVLKPDHFELLETDTDSIYLGLKKERFEDNIADNCREEYERKKADYFITDKCEFGKRQPNRYKVEFSGHRMVALCSKSYCGYNETTCEVKISSKGVQKCNFQEQAIEREKERRRRRGCEQEGEEREDRIGKNIYEMYKEGLKTDAHTDYR